LTYTHKETLLLYCSPHNRGAQAVGEKLARAATVGSLLCPDGAALEQESWNASMLSATPEMAATTTGARPERISRIMIKSTFCSSSTHLGPAGKKKKTAVPKQAKRGAGMALAEHKMSNEEAARLEASIRRRFSTPDKTFFLLYLNSATFGDDADGEALANEIRTVRKALPAVRMLILHEQDPAKGAIEFDHVLLSTPRDLQASGLCRQGAHNPQTLGLTLPTLALTLPTLGPDTPNPGP
jgi:hypothetical protein